MENAFHLDQLEIVSKQGWVVAIGIGFLISIANKNRQHLDERDTDDWGP